jgi:hypothetical protein
VLYWEQQPFDVAAESLALAEISEEVIEALGEIFE